MLNAYMLIGFPGSGKTRWSDEFVASHQGFCVSVSTDAWIEDVARRTGRTYTEVFPEAIKEAGEHLERAVVFAARERKNIVWDQTNLTKKSRAPKIAKLAGYGYDVYAIVFTVPDVVLQYRLKKRFDDTGKMIGAQILDSMKKSYEDPTHEEGFRWIADFTHDEEGKNCVALRLP